MVLRRFDAGAGEPDVGGGIDDSWRQHDPGHERTPRRARSNRPLAAKGRQPQRTRYSIVYLLTRIARTA